MLALGVLSSGLSACTPYGMIAEVAWRTADSAASERGAGGAARDLGIQTALNGAFLSESAGLFARTNTTVFDGRVLLTGVVRSPEARARATVLAWNVAGVSDVVNEIQVGEPDMVDSARDLLLAERFETTLALDTGISQRNYRARIVGRDLYLFGIARDTRERDLVLAYARACPRVRTVTDHTLLKGEDGPGGTGDGSAYAELSRAP
ncbi:BON domain-containing protein [Phaeovibrio sulfidiphilus]|uniref:BON domain-containing protein n=1 Tax=Phaeovibrio sulfidiphilus TaxID=1220600 RepID=A0A8J6YL60_9PROT|nr:BON domain-containing protein [Phaeovibrio sulfidiphilus]MBE1236553.1 BON domain-containing protein [Phaeovibrio sulfidiphilus]